MRRIDARAKGSDGRAGRWVHRLAGRSRNARGIVRGLDLGAARPSCQGHAVYAGSKAAVGAFARSWATEFSGRGIRVNILSPGPTDTDIIEKMGVSRDERSAFEARIAASIPLGRLGQPEELARAALFLASDLSSFVTGIELRVDGGMALL